MAWCTIRFVDATGAVAYTTFPHGYWDKRAWLLPLVMRLDGGTYRFVRYPRRGGRAETDVEMRASARRALTLLGMTGEPESPPRASVTTLGTVHLDADFDTFLRA